MKGVMSYRLRWLIAGALVLVLGTALSLRAQGNPDPYSFKFASGQGMQPIFEGWSHNADGTFEMWFGYYNRNYQETLVVPVGADNKILVAGIGQPDRGQPTVFLPRIQRMAFSVTVPADFGKKELIWSVAVRGTTEKAVAWLQREWEIDPIYAGKTRSKESLANKPPQITVQVPATAAVSTPVTFTATFIDDGLPVPKKGPPSRAIGQETPPTLKPLPDQAEIPVNVPGIGGAVGNSAASRDTPKGATVRWMLWRGPAGATVTPATADVKEQKATSTVTFTKPGTYVFRVIGNDTELKVTKDVTIAVN